MLGAVCFQRKATQTHERNQGWGEDMSDVMASAERGIFMGLQAGRETASMVPDGMVPSAAKAGEQMPSHLPWWDEIRYH